MRFEKNNQLGFTSDRTRKLAKQPISFKGFEGQLEELKKIAGWQDIFRDFVDKLIEENQSKSS
jgi:hypothetical protein